MVGERGKRRLSGGLFEKAAIFQLLGSGPWPVLSPSMGFVWILGEGFLWVALVLAAGYCVVYSSSNSNSSGY